MKGLIFRVVTICFLLIPALLFSQQRDDFLRPFFGFYDSQSLTTAIGRATVASGQVIPGKTSNPANLGLHRFNYVQTSFLRGSFESSGVDKSHTNFGGIYAITPIKVYRGSLVLGFGVHKELDFTDAFQSSTLELAEKGGMYAYEFGASVELQKNLFVGGGLKYLSGEDKLSKTEVDTNSILNKNLNTKYSGFNLTFGFVQRLTSNVQIGASVQFPTFMWVNEKLTTWDIQTPQQSTSETRNYRLMRPLVFHFGAALLYEYYNLFYELEWSDWQDLEFSSDEYFEGDIAQINREIEDELTSTLTHHLGAAFHLPWLPVHVYAGYQYMPVQYKYVYTSNKRESLSFGSSYMLNQQFSIHGSYSYYYWKYSGREENYGMLVFGVSMHY